MRKLILALCLGGDLAAFGAATAGAKEPVDYVNTGIGSVSRLPGY